MEDTDFPENRKPGLPTTKVLGMKLPIIAELGGGMFLVAHPNAPAIANKNCMVSLNCPSEESGVPEAVRAKAVDEFEDFAWPLVRDQFYEEPKRKRQMRMCWIEGTRQVEIFFADEEMQTLADASEILDRLQLLPCDQRESAGKAYAAIGGIMKFPVSSNMEPTGMVEKPVSSDTPDEEELIGRHMTAEAATDVVVNSDEEEASPIILTKDESLLAGDKLTVALNNTDSPAECRRIGKQFRLVGLSNDYVDGMVAIRIDRINAGRGENSNKPKDSDEKEA